MYSPKIKEELVRELYRRKLVEKRPMTKLVNDAVMQYLNLHPSQTSQSEQTQQPKQIMEAENVSRIN